jgi:hypothetical protein
MPKTAEAAIARAEQNGASRTPIVADTFMVSSSIPSLSWPHWWAQNDIRNPSPFPTMARAIALAARLETLSAENPAAQLLGQSSCQSHWGRACQTLFDKTQAIGFLFRADRQRCVEPLEVLELR